MLSEAMKAEGDGLWNETQDLLNRFGRAARRRTGLRLSAHDIAILSLTGFGQQFCEPDPRIEATHD